MTDTRRWRMKMQVIHSLIPFSSHSRRTSSSSPSFVLILVWGRRELEVDVTVVRASSSSLPHPPNICLSCCSVGKEKRREIDTQLNQVHSTCFLIHFSLSLFYRSIYLSVWFPDRAKRGNKTKVSFNSTRITVPRFAARVSFIFIALSPSSPGYCIHLIFIKPLLTALKVTDFVSKSNIVTEKETQTLHCIA